MNDAARPDPRPDFRPGPRPDPGLEPVEHVDSDGAVIEVVTRAEMRARTLRHRAVFIALIHSDGRLLVHQRSPDKDLWPSRWDLAAGGVVAVGEAWEAAAQRELAEELGVHATVEALGGGSYDDADASVVSRVYLARHDGPVTFDDGEVVAARWVDTPALTALMADESMCPDSVALVLPLIAAMITPFAAR